MASSPPRTSPPEIKHPKYTNPFYVLLVIAGIAFCITATAYGVMTVRGLHPTQAQEIDAIHPLVTSVDRYGFAAMMIELAILGVCTVAAIATDEFWERRRRKQTARPDAADESNAQ